MRWTNAENMGPSCNSSRCTQAAVLLGLKVIFNHYTTTIIWAWGTNNFHPIHLLSSLILWLFVATAWLVLCYVMLGIGMLPGVNYGQIFNLSFGNTTCLPIIYILMIYARANACTDVSSRVHSANCRKVSMAFYRGLYASVLAISLFISPTILLFMIVFRFHRKIMAALGLKRDRECFSVL